MFKLESYITPVILSYVEKYVKNFKPEQSQVSLWGGDASFQNLDLRLEVLEEQLNLPFHFVSGHIHELLIHVPWVKITSEPIVITINTIECILKLKDENQSESHVSKQKQKREESFEEEAPPGYIKSIVTKVVNNITINCNNLILKYVEEDIVLSVNVRFLSMQTVNNKWEAAFTDVNSYEVMLRKIVTVQDLTLCLDKMDTSGKIEIYQDPVLYRCSMKVRMIINYLSNTAKRASITRLDLHCEKMEFSITEQQVPMLLRLMDLLMALQSKQFPLSKEKSSSNDEERDSVLPDEMDQIPGTSSEAVGWGGWAWNMVSSFLPVDWDNEWSHEQQLAYSGHTIHLGVYVDDVTLTFKTVESVKEQLFYKSRKIRYKSFLSLRLTGAVIDALLQGITMTNYQIGLGSIQLYSRGNCSCGFAEVVDELQPPLYVIAGKQNANHLKDSLFDDDAVENKGLKRDYKQNIEYHLAMVSVEKLLERCPALVMDYVHHIQLPDDVTPERLAEFNGNFEYSNFPERRVTRYVVGDVTVRLCSGILHRFDTIKQAARKYDYTPYIIPKPDPSVDELPPVTVEEYEALRENISTVETKLILMRGSLQLQLSDHRNTNSPPRQRKIDNRVRPLIPTLSDDPFVSVEFDEIVIKMVQPMYAFRLAACASKQTDLSAEMFNQCHKIVESHIRGLKSQLYLRKNCHTSVIMPCSVEHNWKTLLYSQYWRDADLTRNQHSFHIDSITVTGTKAKLLAAIAIIRSILYPSDPTNPFFCSSLFTDACEERNPVFLELLMETITFQNRMSLVTISNLLNVNSMKVFALSDSQQTFILSGPETDSMSVLQNKPLLSMALQFPKDYNKQSHPPILSFQVAEIRGSFDPLFFQWLDYHITYYKENTTTTTSNLMRFENQDQQQQQQQQTMEGTSSDTATKKKTFPSLQESVHSSSDKDRKKSLALTGKVKTYSRTDESKINPVIESFEDNSQKTGSGTGILAKFIEMYPWWFAMVVSGSVGHIVIYIPSSPMSGIGAIGIEQAKNNSLRGNGNLQILVIKSPTFVVHSANMHLESLAPFLKELPVKLPGNMWNKQTQSFPWTLKIIDFHCYTLQHETQKNFIKKVSLNATIALTTKSVAVEKSKIPQTTLSLCVYIDTSPIILSISEEQVTFMSEIASNILNMLRSHTPESPTTAFYPEHATTTSTISTTREDVQEKDGIILTAWIQWTIAKVAIKMYVLKQTDSPSLKLVLELEDIITSLDLQSVYLKLKSKITTATIFHYISRAPQSQSWDFGEYVGLVMCGREDSLEKGEVSGFLSLTLTKAKSGNVHTRWGAQKKHKVEKKELRADSSNSTNSYITEIDIKMQMMDIILPLSVLGRYLQLVKPFTNLTNSVNKFTELANGKCENQTMSGLTSLNTDALPLIYFEFKGFRLILPASTVARYGLQHDLLLLQLDGIKVTPHAENPICRTPIRSDIYQLAAQANILNVPGSVVEDRQYQINVKGVCVYTTTWKNYQLSVTKRLSQSYLYTMNENPAVEWNKLGNGSSLEPHFSTFPLVTRFDLCLIIAPAIIFKPDTLVCGSAVEINCLTDIETTINLDQIKLISTLFEEIKSLKFEYTEDENLNTVSISQIPSDLKKEVILANESYEESEADYTKDSELKFDVSSLNSTTIVKTSFLQENAILPPFEFLVNCGKVTFVLYEIQKSFSNNEYRIDANEADEDDNTVLKIPLLYLMINQPNVYFSQHHLAQKLQVSCFNIALSLGNEESNDLKSIPTETDYKVYIIETKNGDPHPDTGIPPSFMTVKCEKNIGKSTQFTVDMGRPTKIHCSLSRLNRLDAIKQKILSCFVEEMAIKLCPEAAINPQNICSEESNLKTRSKICLPDLNLTTKQLVFSLTTNSGSETIISLANLTGNASTATRPERIYGNLLLDSLIVSVKRETDGIARVLLNPWCCNLTVYLLWESWQDTNEAIPQIQVQADSDSIYLDFGPEQMKIMTSVSEEFRILMNKFVPNSRENTEDVENKRSSLASSTEQHYKDDLKAGAFQFIDGNADELPFPYQVVFFSYPQQAMAWRYPQPRTLTKLHVSPVPFEITDNEGNYEEKIQCSIEYWSESHMAYQKYLDFYLSETDAFLIDLPQKAPARAVACIWRVVLQPKRESNSKILISSRALAACLRIDSYFNSTIIPNIQASLNIGTIHVSFYNQISSTSYHSLPKPLSEYHLNGMIPETQCFMVLEQKNAIIVFNKWLDGSTLIDVNGTFGIHVLDYGHLNMQEILEPFNGKLQISLTNEKKDLSLVCHSFSLKLGPSVGHTLSTSAYVWADALSAQDANRRRNVVILTRYVIANNSNIPIRFGQNLTDDNILIKSRQCYFYSWRHINNPMLKIAIESYSWSWSRPFDVNTDGTQLVEFSNTANSDHAIFVTVSSLSATQKLVTFMGQLIITNQLVDSFDIKLMKYETSNDGNQVTALQDVFVFHGKDQSCSYVLEDHKSMAIRLRFSGIPNVSWTGDIPLQLNVKWGQPWLVKVPLQERGQFLSIWVRIVTQVLHGRIRILAVLSPLYMIRSHLPVPVKVQIETPSLKVSLNTTVNGRGERQQLYCPGTFEHFHQLTFQLETGVSASNPYVPLSYSSVDQRKFFKRPETEDIDVILKELKDQKDEQQWPFQSDEFHEWIPAEQPQTHVQVKYQDAGLVSSTLLLELQPWCFILNTLGCHVSVISENIELCQIPHYGVVTPPKLEGTFHLGIGIGDTYYTSSALQLARPDWSQSFYMPRIGGLIPVEGNIKTCVDCSSSVSMLSINSSMHEDMRFIRLISSHVIANLTSQELGVAALAIPKHSRNVSLPTDLTAYSFNLTPSKDERQAKPIIQWHLLNMENITENIVLYVSLSLGQRWSCPVRVDLNMSRKCVAVPGGYGTTPVVITTQEDKGTTYITIHLDEHPQLFIDNSCAFKIIIGQANEAADTIVPDTPHFSWMCEIESGTTCHHSLPNFSGRMPDSPPIATPITLLLAASSTDDVNEHTEKESLRWSRSINLSGLTSTAIDQYVRLPPYGDVKLIMQSRCYTTYISIVPISQVEISARDIRSRLLRKESKMQELEMAQESLLSIDEDKVSSNVQSSRSSTSISSFYSALDSASTTESSFSSSDYSSEKQVKRLKSSTPTLSSSSSRLKPIEELKSSKHEEGCATVYFRNITVIIMQDVNGNAQRTEVASLNMTDFIITVESRSNLLQVCTCIGDLQLDNQMFDKGGFDFPVVFIGQSPFLPRGTSFYVNNCFTNSIQQIKQDSLISIDCLWEFNGDVRACKEIRVKVAPISAYIEDTYITQLLDYATLLVPPCFVGSTTDVKNVKTITTTSMVLVPDYILVDAKIISTPLRLQSFFIEPVSILLSVHTSVRLYVALDRSPLYFGTFERKHLLTTPYRLGNALTMHYLSGAIFGAGWVVGSLEILGSPGGLAQALGSGLKDFVSLPFQGLLQGPWGFIIGVTHGSASLMKHITAGTVNSVTKLASSVARNLDRLTLDEEHLQRQEESRRIRPQGMAQGLYQGLTGFGMSLLAAVAGLAHHPLQQVWSGEATTRGLVTGVGLGLVGVVTKPLSGAAELVALTGQGLLQGAGWNSLPTPKQRPIVQYSNANNNASVRYAWRLLPLLSKSHDSILHVASADFVEHQGSNRAVTLVLTRQALLLVNAVEDSVEKVLSLKELSSVDHTTESTMLCLYCPPTVTHPARPLSPTEQPEMDQEMRARVAEYVRTSSTGLASISTNSDAQSETIEKTAPPHPENTLTFYVSSDARNYLLSLFNTAKRQSLGSGFSVL